MLNENGNTSTDSFDLECHSVNKSFGQFKAVDEVSFQIPKGSFFSILGPSGCGKTTLLRMLAGFQHPDTGDILIKNKSVLNTPPNKRPVNMVFQHLALFPTMTVAENIAYGLKRRGVSKSEQQSRIQDVLERVELPDSGNKRIDQLSGGQKQRIAIARCLVLKPDVLLLDEPLGALDLKLREQMKIELKHLQRTFGTTFIYITHDQSEALVMSDQVAIMNNGRFEQVGTPQALYYHPTTPFVASFVGDSNRWHGSVEEHTGHSISLTTEQGQTLCGIAAVEHPFEKGDRVTVFVRPEAISISTNSSNDDEANPSTHANQCQGKILNVLFDGARSQIVVDINKGESMSVSLPQTGEHSHLKTGDSVTLRWQQQQCLCFPYDESISASFDGTSANSTSAN